MRTSDIGDSEDKSFHALSLILDAWSEGAENGVSAEHMAYAALFTALSDLVTLHGEDAVLDLARGLERRIGAGEFTLGRTNH